MDCGLMALENRDKPIISQDTETDNEEIFTAWGKWK